MAFPEPGGVVILVDSKKRDLAVASLIAHQLQKLNIPAYLEPLESYKGALNAYRPRMILFNHLLASHLVKYSQELHSLGVLTAVLPNEGIMYEEDERRFNAGKSHNEAHIDLFFCWHRLFKEALLETGFNNTEINVIGVPRFDFYFEPWSKLWYQETTEKRNRPKLLVATNFGLAVFKELPRAEADEFFSSWSERIKGYDDYWTAVEIHHRSRERLKDYLKPLLESGKYDISLRPHPREDPDFYQRWIDTLKDEEKSRIEVDVTRNITTAILECDVEISMDRCTTALEAWIAGKPTIELGFERHAILSTAEREAMNVQCDNPDALPDIVEQQLAQPTQPEFAKDRKEHLDLWCNAPDGTSTLKIAQAIEKALKEKGLKEPPQSRSLPYPRKGLKLKLLRSLNLPYHWTPFTKLRHTLSPKTSELSWRRLSKSILPSDQTEYQNLLQKLEK